MPTLISLLFPTFLHGLLLLSLVSLALLSIPTNTRFPSILSPITVAIYRLWAALLPVLNRFQHRSFLWFQLEGASCYRKGMAQLKILFSSALPENEETCFEEQFKYLIVTSSVLNDLSVQYAPSTDPPGTPATNGGSRRDSRHTQLTLYYALIYLLSASAAALFTFSLVHWIGALCFHWSPSSYASHFLVQATFLGVISMIYRKLRYTKIRGIYERLLQQLQRILQVTSSSDHLIDQLVDRMRDVETISQGYTLAPVGAALDPPRFHQSSHTHAMQSAARAILTPYMESVNSLLQQTMPLTRSINLSALRGMYNVKSIPSSFGGCYDDAVASLHSHESLECLVYKIRSNRREWFMRLLALEMMTLGHDSARRDYESLLGIVNDMMAVMEQQTQLALEKMINLLSSDLYTGPLDTVDNEAATDQQSRAVLNNLAVLEKHVWDLQTKIVLCRHDAKGNEASFTRMNERFAVMDQDISHLLAQWEESKASLSDLVGSEPKKCASRSSLPSPPSSPGSTIRKRTSLRRSYALSTAPTSLSMASHMIDSPSGPPLPSLKGLQSQAPPSPEVSRLSIVQPRDRNSATPWTHSSGDLPKPSSTEPFCS